MKKESNFKIYLIFAILIFLFHGISLTYYFFSDDGFWLLRSPTLFQKGVEKDWYIVQKPVTAFFYIIERIFFGTNAMLYHLINLILFTITAILLYKVCTKVFNSSKENAFIATLIFILSPTNTEPVSWISDQEYFLLAIMLLYALLLFDRFLLDNNKKAFLGITGISILAIFTHVPGIIIPVSFLAYAFFIRKKEIWEEQKKHKLAFLIGFFAFFSLIFVLLYNLIFGGIATGRGEQTMFSVLFCCIILICALFFGEKREKFTVTLFMAFLIPGILHANTSLIELLFSWSKRYFFLPVIALTILISVELEKYFGDSGKKIKKILFCAVILALAFMLIKTEIRDYSSWKADKLRAAVKIIKTQMIGKDNFTIYYNDGSQKIYTLNNTFGSQALCHHDMNMYNVINCITIIELGLKNMSAFCINEEELSKIPPSENEVVINFSPMIFWDRRTNEGIRI